jgi:Domain of unknown function (DU1801)
MASQNKTTATQVDVKDFINSYVVNEQQKQDSFRLLELMQEWSGFKPKMWGPTMIGFGEYHYKYESGREGDFFMIGFSPRKPKFSLYVTSVNTSSKDLLKQLGEYKMGKACIYFKKLSDLNLEVLEKLCKETIEYIKEHNECSCKD